MPPSVLLRAGRRLLGREVPIGELHDREDDEEQRDRPGDETHEGGAHVGAVRGVMRGWMMRVGHGGIARRQATRTLVMTSFFWIFFITSSPETTLPKTV